MVVYCTKCGTKNEDTAKRCIQCGEPLYAVGAGRSRREEEMCFGLPRYWSGLIFGIFLIILGIIFMLEQFYQISIELGWVILIFIGILIIAGALYRSSRR